MILGLLLILTALLNGVLVVRLFNPLEDQTPRWAARLFEVSAGMGFGFGLASATYTLLLAARLASTPWLVGVDLGILAGLVSFSCLKQRAPRPTPGPPAKSVISAHHWVLMGAATFGMIFVAAGMWAQATSNPHGAWDAWAIWNLRARFLAGPGETWRYALSPLLDKTHPDYPLLLSALIARSWKAAGAYPVVIPLLVAALFFLGTAGLLLASLAILRGLSTALLAILCLLTGFTYLIQPMAQYSDVPLGFYYLAAIALAALAFSGDSIAGRNAIFWAGFAAGLAAWTKNEGILFLAVFSLFLLASLYSSKDRKDFLKYASWALAGLLPGLLLTAWLKFSLAPILDPVVREGHQRIASAITRVQRFHRLGRVVFKNLAEFGYFWFTHPLLYLGSMAAALGISRGSELRPALRCAAATLAFVFTGYCVVSIGSPTPFDRFYAQLFPSLLLLAFLLLQPMESILTCRVQQERPSRSRGKPGSRGSGCEPTRPPLKVKNHTD